MAALPQLCWVLRAQLWERGRKGGLLPPALWGPGHDCPHPAGVTARGGARHVWRAVSSVLPACPRGLCRGRWAVPGDDTRCHISE